MINLLPEAYKKELGAGRTNVMLMRLNFINLFALAVLALILITAFIALNVSRTTAREQDQDNVASIAQYKDVQLRAEEYRANLAVAKQIKDIQIRYSDALIKIAQALPSGVALKSLQLSPESVGKPIEIELTADTYDSAIQIKNSFQKAELFSDISITSLQGTTKGSGQTSVRMKITIDKEVLQ